jgi:tRNA(fMet)-specific endonuclease VapC
MVMAWLLDTNVWIHYLKNPASPVRGCLAAHTPGEIVTCSVVRAELLHGAMKYGVPARRMTIVVETLAPYRSLPFDDDAAGHYARIRHELEEAGEVIGPHDLMIAAICEANSCSLVTANVAEFQRVRSLRVEDWLTGA